MEMLRLQEKEARNHSHKQDAQRHAHGEVVRRRLGGALARDEAAPRLVALVDDLGRVLLVLRLTRERKLVLGLAIGDLVDAI